MLVSVVAWRRCWPAVGAQDDRAQAFSVNARAGLHLTSLTLFLCRKTVCRIPWLTGVVARNK